MKGNNRFQWLQFMCKPIRGLISTRRVRYIALHSWDNSEPATNQAQRCLTWQIGRDAVFQGGENVSNNNNNIYFIQ